jgi:hypothetical protein
MKRILILATFAALTAGCDLKTLETQGSADPVEVSHSIDSVKLISPAITASTDPSTFLQPRYAVSDDHRLLLRFEKLKDFKDGVLTQGKKVELKLTLPSDNEAAAAVDELRICFMTRTWMQRATWWRWQPWGGDAGRWNREGGDFGDCVKPAPVQGSELRFDVTAWFLQYPGDYGTNYGFILIGPPGAPVTVLGESSTPGSPKMVWMENPK